MEPELCKAELHIADDHSDNHATMICELQKGHKGSHRETWTTEGKPAVVTFEVDHRD